jgi:hypothetical protein
MTLSILTRIIRRIKSFLKHNLDTADKKEFYKISLTLLSDTLKSQYTNLCVHGRNNTSLSFRVD